MTGYSAPLRDMNFVLFDLFDGSGLSVLPDYGEMTQETITPILEAAALFCQEVLHPLNRPGDEEGCHWDNGQVRTPTGFPAAYEQFRAGGWSAMSSEEAHGGLGLPKAVDVLIQEMMCSANLSFAITVGLSHGAYLALRAHGGQDPRIEQILRHLTDGRWSGTMCLTEPQCGTDLGLLRTKAVPRGDGSYGLTGAKIFISGGEHDLTENIIHLVLARLPEAPPGVKGISLFVVPKHLPEASDNGVSCGALEHKMGIKASPTCAMYFEDAQGWLVGEPHRGLQAMFSMMNVERLAVGLQGLGLAEASYQGALAYARERRQGRSPAGAREPNQTADRLLVHPDVRRMLLTQRALIEGGRALAVWVALHEDLHRRHPDPETAQRAGDFVALMTPVVKALLTDLGFEATNLGLQVFGGHGFIRENGMEQYVRDCRIAQIYEGANGIQALDLVARKLPLGGGRLLYPLFHPIAAALESAEALPTLAGFSRPLSQAFERLQQATLHLARTGANHPEQAAAVASDYLHLLGLTSLGYLWLRMAKTALQSAETDPTNPFLRAKVQTARVFMEVILPRTATLHALVLAKGKAVLDFDDEGFV